MRFSQNNMLEKTKKYKKIIVVCIVAILIYGHFIYFHISDIHSKDYL